MKKKIPIHCNLGAAGNGGFLDDLVVFSPSVVSKGQAFRFVLRGAGHICREFGIDGSIDSVSVFPIEVNGIEIV